MPAKQAGEVVSPRVSQAGRFVEETTSSVSPSGCHLSMGLTGPVLLKTVHRTVFRAFGPSKREPFGHSFKYNIYEQVVSLSLIPEGRRHTGTNRQNEAARPQGGRAPNSRFVRYAAEKSVPTCDNPLRTNGPGEGKPQCMPQKRPSRHAALRLVPANRVKETPSACRKSRPDMRHCACFLRTD